MQISHRQLGAIILLLSVQLPAQFLPTSTPVVTWQLVESKLTLHEPVLLRLTVQNTANTAAEFNLGHSFIKGIAMRVTDADGRPMGVPLPEPTGLGETGIVRIEPRATYVRDFLVNNWYSFSQPGSYLIGVTLKNPILLGELAIAPPPESFTTIVIGEFDEARLRQQCEALLSRITAPMVSAVSVEDAWQAAGALIQIHHPIAIKFLVRSLKAPTFVAAGRALGPLADFGTPQAVEALIEASRPGVLNSEMARSHLGRVATKIQDPILRARAHAAIEAPQARQPK